ncbi:hypothetical protein GCM10007315_04590 [Gemmobacter tilapiae]|uniref:Uncharacterized protein n=1 Tax=Neogemmobacter tilapiae TaxID=875041 RepID=A0A918TG19_9RHOB|nr:hypothetical protein GCM10007315_04590 [Gemmobacter tilapiae]
MLGWPGHLRTRSLVMKKWMVVLMLLAGCQAEKGYQDMGLVECDESGVCVEH